MLHTAGLPPATKYEHISQLAFNITAKFLGWGSHSRAGLHPCRTLESYLSSLTWSQMQTGNQYSCLCLLVYLFSLSGVLFYVHHPSIRALLFTASKTITCTNSGFQRALRGILGKAPYSGQVWDLAKLRQRFPSVTVFISVTAVNERVQLQCQNRLQYTTLGPAVEHPTLLHPSVTHLWSLITYHLLVQCWYHKHFGKVNLVFIREDRS